MGTTDGRTAPLLFQVLGPVRVTDGSEPVALGGPKQRLVLALLIVDIGRMVSTDRLIEGVWGDDPPDTARKTLQGYIHHLRSVLGERIQTESAGYSLTIDPEQLDVAEFERLVAKGRGLLDTEPGQASEDLSAAVAMWRGQPFADLDGSLALEPEITRLSELRLSAIEDRVEADVSIGAAAEVVGELESLTREYPLRERFRSQHMLALYRSGRQAEALRAYEHARRYLAEELGLDPSPELRRLEEQILQQDPALGSETAPVLGKTPRAFRGYELRTREGSGALGAVHRAYQTSVGREVALKVIKQELADEPEFIERFDEETRRIAGLEHPHIVALHDAWREPGAAYQVTRWLGGGNMRSAMDRDAMGTTTSMQVLDQVGAALAYAHRHGVDHCRVKPANVLLDEDGNAYLTDFAIAGTGRIVASDEDAAYLAPELHRDESPTPASDVYSLAMLAHELLTGERPSSDTTAESTVAATLGVQLATELRRALHDDPSLRHQRIEDLLRGLRQAAGIDVAPAAAAVPVLPRSDVRNPYKGLRAFQESDAADFFGRNTLVGHLVEAAARHRFVAVVGPSGSGKSSAVKAGLIPALRAARADADPPLLVSEMFPGSYPFEELEAALLRVAVERPSGMVEELMSDSRGLLRISKQILPDDGSELLLVIDQFEELFSIVTSENVRSLFLDNLVTALGDGRSRLRVVTTLRADFFDRPLGYNEFGEMLRAGLVPVTVPDEDGLARAISGPARSVGLDLEPGLVAEIVRDVAGQPGGLPLMQYALTEMFQQRESNVLTIGAYRSTGGVLGALGTRAEELYQSLSGAGRHAIKQVFLRLVSVDESADDIRRRVRRTELSALPVDQVELNAAVQLFGAHRLLSFDRDPVTRGPTIEVAHEALLREWTRFRDWIETQREDLLLQRQLAMAVGEWETAGREKSYLLRGGRLAHFESWAASSELTLTRAEVMFLDAGRAERELQEERERRAARRLKRMLAGVSALAIVAAIAGVFALVQRHRADSQAERAVNAQFAAETRRLVADAPQLVDTNRQVALLLAAEAFKRDPGADTLGALQQVLVQTQGFLGYVGAGSAYTDVAFLGDGRVVGLHANGATVFDSTTGAAVTDLSIPSPTHIEIAPNGTTAAIVTGSDTVRIVDFANRNEILEPLRHDAQVLSLAFNTDGSVLAVGEFDGWVHLWDMSTGTTSRRFLAHPEREAEGIEVPIHEPGATRVGTRALAWSEDDSRIVTGGLVWARVWDPITGSKVADDIVATRPRTDVARAPAAVRDVGFAAGTSDRISVVTEFNVLDLDISGATEPAEKVFSERINTLALPGTVSDATLTKDHAALAVPGGQLLVVPRSGPSTVLAVDVQLSGAPSIATSTDGRRLAVAGQEGILIWSLAGDGLIGRSLSQEQQSEVTISDDGQWLVLSSPAREQAVLWNLSGTTPTRVELPDDPPSQFAWLGWGNNLLTWDFADQIMRLRPLDSLDATIDLGRTPGLAVALDPDGRKVAIGGGPPLANPEIKVFDTTTGRPLTDDLTVFNDASLADRTVQSLSFSPSGDRLVAATSDGAMAIWDTATWELVRDPIGGGGQIVQAEYSLDGKWLATISSEGKILLRDLETLQPDGGPLVGNTDAVTGFSHGPFFTPDGRYMITTADGQGRLWDLTERTQIGTVFPNIPGRVASASVTGHVLATFTEDSVIVWDLDVSRWFDIACKAAGRNLALDEWAQFGPTGQPYETTCDMWPAASE